MMTQPTPFAALVAGVAALGQVDVAGLPDAAVLELLRMALRDALDAVTAELVTSADTRDLFRADGFHSASGWLQAHGRMSGRRAKELVDLGRLARDLPELGSAARAGEASAEQLHQVHTLVKDLGLGPVQQVDEILADLAGQVGPREMGLACQRVRDSVDPDGPEPDPTAHERRGVSIARSGSLWKISGRLDAEGAATLTTAIDAVMTPPTPDDTLAGVTPEMRRADALVELGRRALIGGDLATVGGVRPQVGILLTPDIINRLGCPDPHCPGSTTTPAGASAPDPHQQCRQQQQTLPDDLLGRAGLPAPVERPWLEWVGTVGDAVAARLACDAATWLAVLDPTTGLPLHLGRGVRIVPAWMRKALAARDRGCRWPGCTVPAAWCDAHHLVHWLVGGDTNIDNCVLLCRSHHMRVHEDKWFIRLDPKTGHLWIWRPTGEPYELAPSTPHISPTHHDLPACRHPSRRRRPARGPTPPPGKADPAPEPASGPGPGSPPGDRQPGDGPPGDRQPGDGPPGGGPPCDGPPGGGPPGDSQAGDARPDGGALNAAA